MDAESRPFEPDWTLHPGICLRKILDDRGISKAELARMTGLGPETIAGILGFTVAIDRLTARRLEAALGGPSAQFWLNYQANYQRDLARGAKDVSRE